MRFLLGILLGFGLNDPLDYTITIIYELKSKIMTVYGRRKL